MIAELWIDVKRVGTLDLQGAPNTSSGEDRSAAAGGQPDSAGFLPAPTLSYASPYGQSMPPQNPANLNSCVVDWHEN
jgi:hypothetical protein